MNERIKLNLPAQLPYGAAISELLKVICQGIEKRVVREGVENDVISAFNEAFNNIVEHSYQGTECGQILVELYLDGHTLHLELSNQGKAFMPEDIASPQELSEGGMGLYIIHSLMDVVHYTRNNGSNKLSMMKFLNSVPVHPHPADTNPTSS